jgi:hypothetical protein
VFPTLRPVVESGGESADTPTLDARRWYGGTTTLIYPKFPTRAPFGWDPNARHICSHFVQFIVKLGPLCVTGVSCWLELTAGGNFSSYLLLCLLYAVGQATRDEDGACVE